MGRIATLTQLPQTETSPLKRQQHAHILYFSSSFARSRDWGEFLWKSSGIWKLSEVHLISYPIISATCKLSLLSSHPKFPLGVDEVYTILTSQGLKINIPFYTSVWVFLFWTVSCLVKKPCAKRNCSFWQIYVDMLQTLTFNFSCRVCSFRWGCSIFWGGGSRGLSELLGRPNLQLPGWGGHNHRSWLPN